MSGAQTCQWCGTAMAPSRQPKRFCSNAHRGLFHEGCRRFGERQFEAGAVTIEQLRGEAVPAITSDTDSVPLTPSGSVEPIPDQGDDHHE